MSNVDICNDALAKLGRLFTKEELEEMWKQAVQEPVPDWAEALAREMVSTMPPRFSFVPITMQSLKGWNPEDTTPLPPQTNEV